MLLFSVTATVMYLQAIFHSMVLRVRQSNGVLNRIEVQSTNTTIADLCRRIISTSNVSNFNISFAGNEYSILEMQQNSTLISETKLKNGDIVNIIRTEAFISTSSTSSKIRRQVLKSAPRVSKIVTIADLEKRKKGLFLFKLPKSDPSKILRVSISVERILGRINSKGGVAILLGDLSNSTVGSKSPLKNFQFDALAAIELDAGRGLPGDLSSPTYLQTIQNVMKVASSLGLQVLGCCIRSEDGCYWGVQHVHSALQIQQQLVNTSCVGLMNNTFIVLSLGNSSSENRVKVKGAARTPSSFRMKYSSDKTTASSKDSNSISCEAFILSPQAQALAERDLLLSIRKSGGKLHDTVHLEGPVCLKNDEVVELDPWLFAIPIPLTALEISPGHTSTVKSTRKQTSSSSSPQTLCTAFDHSFPTPRELSECSSSSNAGMVAKRFLVRLLKHFKPNRPLPQEASSRLRDPHLLLHLSGMLDPAAFDLLLEHISPSVSSGPNHVENSKPLSTELAMVMQSVQAALDSDDLSTE